MVRGLDGIFDLSGDPVVALCGFEGPRERSLIVSGGYGEGETPLPIPNRAVKPLSADGTWLARARESRTPPVYSYEPPPRGGSSTFAAWRAAREVPPRDRCRLGAATEVRQTRAGRPGLTLRTP